MRHLIEITEILIVNEKWDWLEWLLTAKDTYDIYNYSMKTDRDKYDALFKDLTPEHRAWYAEFLK